MRRSGKAMSVPAGVAFGIGISLALTVLGAVIVTGLVSAQRIGEQAIGYGCMIILSVAALMGSFCACAAVKHRKLMLCAVVSAGYYLMLLLFALLFGGQFEGMGVTALMVALGGGFSLIACAAGNRSGARKPKIARYR